VAEFQITRTLRGELSGTIHVRSSYKTWDLLLPGDWQAENVEMIFFLPKETVEVREGLQGFPIAQAVRLNNRPIGHALTRNLRRLTVGRQILNYVNNMIESLGDETFDPVYVTPAYGITVGGNPRIDRWIRVRLPDSNAAEAMARRWIHSQDPKIRTQGIQMLHGFKTDDNVEILQAMLFDNSFSVYETGEVEFRRYEVREEAFRILRSWSIKVEQPVTREEHIVAPEGA
jgi:hypothetical protein